MTTLSCFFMFLPHDKSRNTPMLKTKTLNPIPNFNSSLSLKCHYSSISHQNNFTIQYLVTNFGFSFEAATRASKRVSFYTSEKPDTVIAIFKSFGFSDSQINHIVSKAPNILTCFPYKRILPKFEFLLLKGASTSDVVEIVYRNPRILYSSLDNTIIPTFELVRRCFTSNDEVIQYMSKYRSFLGKHIFVNNVKLLLDYGLTYSNIRYLLLNSLGILGYSNITRALDMIKEMGFLPSAVPNPKVIVLKKWGWTDEMILEAFMKKPRRKLSTEKINKVMRFWVNELGWDSSILVKRPEFFAYSLKNRVIPRACVISYLISKGLIENNDKLWTPFAVKDKVFLEMYVECFNEERHNLLKLYQEKMDGKKIKENGEVFVSY